MFYWLDRCALHCLTISGILNQIKIQVKPFSNSHLYTLLKIFMNHLSLIVFLSIKFFDKLFQDDDDSI